MTKPLTGYEKEIAILHAEANQSTELLEQFKGLLRTHEQAIARLRELHQIHYNGTACSCCEGENECVHCGWNYPCPTIQALDA